MRKEEESKLKAEKKAAKLAAKESKERDKEAKQFQTLIDRKAKELSKSSDVARRNALKKKGSKEPLHVDLPVIQTEQSTEREEVVQPKEELKN